MDTGGQLHGSTRPGREDAPLAGGQWGVSGVRRSYSVIGDVRGMGVARSVISSSSASLIHASASSSSSVSWCGPWSWLPTPGWHAVLRAQLVHLADEGGEQTGVPVQLLGG